MTTINDNLRSMLKEMGITLDKLESDTGVSKRTWQRIMDPGTIRRVTCAKRT